MNPLLLAAINARNNGNQQEAIYFLKCLILSEPKNTEAWFWLARVLPEPEQKKDCYRYILNMDPSNLVAKTLLQAQLELHPGIEMSIRQSNLQFETNLFEPEGKIPSLNEENNVHELQGMDEIITSSKDQLQLPVSPGFDPDTGRERKCLTCGLIADPEDNYCIQCGHTLPWEKRVEQRVSSEKDPAEKVNTSIPVSPLLPRPVIDLPELIPYSKPDEQQPTAPPEHITEPSSPSHRPKRKNGGREVGPETRHWMVKLGMLVMNVSFVLPWMYGSAQSIFSSRSDSFGVIWLIENMDETILPISLVFIFSWSTFLLAIKPRRRLAKFLAVATVICQCIVMYQINDISGWSNYGYGMDFLGGLFTGSVYVEASIGTYSALLASFLILIGLFMTKNDLVEDFEEEPLQVDESLSGQESASYEKSHAPAKQFSAPDAGSWFYIKRGIAVGLAAGLGTTVAAGPLAGIPTAIIVFIYVGFFYKDKRIGAQAGR